MTVHYATVTENILYEKWKNTEDLDLFRVNTETNRLEQVDLNSDDGENLIRYEYVKKNLDAVYSIMEYISGSTANLKKFAFSNLVGNIVIFIPLGIYLPLLKKDKRVITNLLLIFIVSLFVEIIQRLLGIGASDIDDIILNCLGGWVGILGYKFLLLLLRDEKKVRTTITILSAIVGLPVLLYLLFMVRLRL